MKRLSTVIGLQSPASASAKKEDEYQFTIQMPEGVLPQETRPRASTESSQASIRPAAKSVIATQRMTRMLGLEYSSPLMNNEVEVTIFCGGETNSGRMMLQWEKVRDNATQMVLEAGSCDLLHYPQVHGLADEPHTQGHQIVEQRELEMIIEELVGQFGDEVEDLHIVMSVRTRLWRLAAAGYAREARRIASILLPGTLAAAARRRSPRAPPTVHRRVEGVHTGHHMHSHRTHTR